MLRQIFNLPLHSSLRHTNYDYMRLTFWWWPSPIYIHFHGTTVCMGSTNYKYKSHVSCDVSFMLTWNSENVHSIHWSVNGVSALGYKVKMEVTDVSGPYNLPNTTLELHGMLGHISGVIRTHVSSVLTSVTWIPPVWCFFLCDIIVERETNALSHMSQG